MWVNGYNKEVHHIRKLADIAQKQGKDQPEWIQNMLARRRKTLVVCLECHKKIHSGRYDSQAIKRSYAFEPDETEIAHVRFGGGLLEKRCFMCAARWLPTLLQVRFAKSSRGGRPPRLTLTLSICIDRRVFYSEDYPRYGGG